MSTPSGAVSTQLGQDCGSWRPFRRSTVGVSPELIQLMGWEIGMEFNVEVVHGALVLEPTKP
jgi:hypothetical protein